MARCALELCLTDGCWFERVRLGDAVQMFLRRLADEAGFQLPKVSSSDDRAA